MSAPVDYAGQDLEATADLHNYNRWVVSHFDGRLGNRVLEIGAGIGTITAAYLDQCTSTTLVEPSQLFERLATRFADDPRVDVHDSLLDPLVDAHPEWLASFDSVLSVNVLEHVEDDIGMLKTSRRLLRPGGSLLLAVPAMPLLFGTLDELVDHHRRYTRTSLGDAVRAAGFTHIKLGYFDIFGVVPWFVAGRVLRRRTVDAGPARLYDRAVIPWAKHIERRLPLPIGKNLFCIATAP